MELFTKKENRKYLVIILVILGILGAVAISPTNLFSNIFGNNKEEFTNFNNQVVARQAEILIIVQNLDQKVTASSTNGANQEALAFATKDISDSKVEFEQLPYPEQAKDFRDSAIELYRTYLEILQSNYKNLIDISADTKIPENEKTTLKQDTYTQMNKKIDDAISKLKTEQEKFSRNIGFSLVN